MTQPKNVLIATLVTLTTLQPILQAASSLPTGGAFTAGAGKISTSGNILTINQNSLKGIIDWNTFSIAAGSTVNFKNGAGATLNRVTGVTPTSILGQLWATGNVYLLNPEGILIGRGATIHTGGDFLATTLNLPSSSFLSSAPLQFSGNSQAAVVNLGDLASNGGSIYLIGHSVTNNGVIATPNGTTALAAGAQVLITDSSSSQKVAVQAPGGDVTNAGFISAAQAELKSNGGNIYALAGNNGGQIQATGTATQNGHVWLVATSGTTNVSGLITATNANGTGGDIETSGAHVLTNAATIRTGKNGNWLLDPDDLNIDSTLAGTIETSLNGGTNVTEQTTASGTGGSGDITVASPITWSTAADLTLSAYRNIALNAGITNTGSGSLTLRADNTSTGTGTITGAGVIDFSNSTGNVALLYNPVGGYASPTVYTSNFGAINGSWTAPLDGRVSSQYTAYMLVNTAADLENVSNNAYGTYALGQNIDLSSVSNFTPVAGNAPNGNFWGIFDGMGHTVSNLTLASLTTNDVGFFQSVIGQVRNLNLTNVNITTNANNETVGAISAELQGTISNSSASGVIHAGVMTNQLVDYAGGLVGTMGFGPTLQGSHSSVVIDAGANNNGSLGGALDAGGLVAASLPASTIENSYATGSVTVGNGAKGGGLIGDSEFGQITNSYATGNVTAGQDALVGGLVGNSYSSITGSHATGTVVGGDTNNSGTVAGGLVGYSTGTITGSYATGSVTGGADAQVGGLAGYSSAAILNSTASGAVTVGNDVDAGAYAGGLVGMADSGSTITSSFASGTVTGGIRTFLGGLVGMNNDAITTSYATGAVLGSSQSRAGGLSGYSLAPISVSYAMGSVTAGAGAAIGGLVGILDSSLTDTYARGAVTMTGSGYPVGVGGLVGEVFSGTIATSYSSGLVTNPTGYLSGGLVGENQGGANITLSYWDSEVNGSSLPAVGQGNGTGVTPLTTAQLQSGAMPVGFNVNNSVWVAPSGVYPYFGWQGPLVPISGTAYNGSSIIASAGVGILSSNFILGTLITNSSGFYSVVEPQNMVASGVLSYLITNGSANTFSDGAGPGGFANMDLHVGTLSILNASNTTLSGINAALANALGGNTGSNFLFAVPGGQLGLTGGTNFSIASSAASLTVDQPLTATGNILINSTGNLSIAASNAITASAGNNVTLVTGGLFANNAGSSALSVTGGGKWLVYSQSPLNDITGGLSEDYIQYDAAYGDTTPAAAGNGFLYTLAPFITESLTGTVSKTYDGTTAASLSSGNFISTGAVNGDTVNFASSATGTYVDANAGSNIGLTTPGLSILSASNGAIPVYGYQLASSSLSGNVGIINPAALIYTATSATQLFGAGNNVFTGTVSGFVAGQTLASATTGTAVFNSTTTSTSAVGTYGIFGSGLTADHGNYVFTQAAGNATALTIAAASTPTPPPTSPPAPPTTNTTLTIDLNNVTVTTGQTPVFTATYIGAPVGGIDIASILSGLAYQITPSLNGPGTYKITATGIAPAGYLLSFVAGKFTVVDNSPATLPILTSLFQPEVPSLLLLPESGVSSSNFLAPVNALGLFQIDVTSNASSSFGSAVSAGFGVQPNSLSQSFFFSGTNDKADNFVAGAKP